MIVSAGYLTSPCSGPTCPLNGLHRHTVACRTRYYRTGYSQILLLTLTSYQMAPEPANRCILLYGSVALSMGLQVSCAFADVSLHRFNDLTCN